ncbi:hypothetical protein NQ176_g1635 [Zarea fungicola]|uniref:Uncharacterized protein n=1 Tax=Zarea fungicola TaxID=93591 RepID=A0ACC1NUP1_9HYPO|nr:hypothetical protein NQ176_g1635 [Lecanicillium fungicola]
MPLTSLYLISLDHSTNVSTFIPILITSLPPNIRPLLIARPLRWIIDPWFTSPSPAAAAAVNTLSTTSWDLLLIFPSVVVLPDQVAKHIRQLLTGSLTDAKLAPTSKDLELSADVLQWFKSPAAPKTAPSMLNLIAFNEGKHGGGGVDLALADGGVAYLASPSAGYGGKEHGETTDRDGDGREVAEAGERKVVAPGLCFGGELDFVAGLHLSDNVSCDSHHDAHGGHGTLYKELHVELECEWCSAIDKEMSTY